MLPVKQVEHHKQDNCHDDTDDYHYGEQHDELRAAGDRHGLHWPGGLSLERRRSPPSSPLTATDVTFPSKWYLSGCTGNLPDKINVVLKKWSSLLQWQF